MISSKPKSGLSEASAQKITPATPRVNKLGRAGSTKSDPILVSPHQNPDRRSPKSVDSKPAIDRRSPKTTTTTTTPDKQPRASKVPELQAQLGVVQEDLKKAREQLASVEIEKSRTLDELNDAKKLADEVNEKLKEALVAQRRAEENLEIENFRADELEQAGIDTALKREAHWKTELEGIREQHNADLAALISATQELARVKQELAISSDEKNNAVNNADDSMKIAEVNAQKVELLSDEVRLLKSLLDSEVEAKSGESTELVKKLGSEVAALKQELERSRASDGKLAEMEELVEALHAEVVEAKRSESDAIQLVGEWKKKAELLEARVEEAIHSEMSSQDSLSTAMKQLEEGNASLQDAESEIAVLKGKVESLDIEVARYETDLEESDRRLRIAQQEALELGGKVEALESEVQELEEKSTQALNKEKAATAARIESLSEERNKLIHELEIARDEGEKSKRAMEGLASALHEVSMEARETQERLLMKQSEVESAHEQMEELKAALVNGRESYEVMLDEAKYEIVCLQKTIERSEEEFETMKGEWVAKELSYAREIKKLEEEPASIKTEMDKMVLLLNEAQIIKEDNAQLLSKLKNAESDASIVDEVVQEAKGENLQLRERLLDKENALQSITQENDELRIRDAAALDKIKELTALLAEASAKNSEGNGALSYGEKDYPLPKEVEIPVLNASESGKPYESFTVVGKPDEKSNGNYEKEETLEDFSSEREHEDESIDDESDSKMESMSLDLVSGLSNEKIDNGATSPTKGQPQRKKKPLLQKFGSLLKKKSNQK